MTKQYDYASFYPGQPFPYEQAETPSDYLETALAAERYIASKQLEDDDGVYWQEDGQSAYDISLFKGASGIAFFYLELHKATGEQRFADIARSAVLRISRFWRNAADKPVILFPGASACSSAFRERAASSHWPTRPSRNRKSSERSGTSSRSLPKTRSATMKAERTGTTTACPSQTAARCSSWHVSSEYLTMRTRKNWQ